MSATTKLTDAQLRRLALRGAPYRLAELAREEQAIRAAFPELFTEGRPRKQMSADARKAVSERMRKYWRDRRKGGESK